MVIVDIDQDFFFDPPMFSGDFGVKRKEQSQVISVREFINRYNLRGKQYTIFKNHYQAYWYIKNYFGKIDKLLHFDAHYDFYGSADELNVGNWVGHLIKDGICRDVDWIVANPELFNGDPSYSNMRIREHYGMKFFESMFDFKNHSWQGDIDDIIFTISYDFCPNMNVLNEFIKEMNAID